MHLLEIRIPSLDTVIKDVAHNNHHSSQECVIATAGVIPPLMIFPLPMHGPP